MKINVKGQNAIEYLLVFIVVVLVLLFFVRPGGYLARNLDQTLNASLNVGVSEAVRSIDYLTGTHDVYDEPGTIVHRE